jgi:hypothetical protein
MADELAAVVLAAGFDGVKFARLVLSSCESSFALSNFLRECSVITR